METHKTIHILVRLKDADENDNGIILLKNIRQRSVNREKADKVSIEEVTVYLSQIYGNAGGVFGLRKKEDSSVMFIPFERIETVDYMFN